MSPCVVRSLWCPGALKKFHHGGGTLDITLNFKSPCKHGSLAHVSLSAFSARSALRAQRHVQDYGGIQALLRGYNGQVKYTF